MSFFFQNGVEMFRKYSEFLIAVFLFSLLRTAAEFGWIVPGQISERLHLLVFVSGAQVAVLVNITILLPVILHHRAFDVLRENSNYPEIWGDFRKSFRWSVAAFVVSVFASFHKPNVDLYLALSLYLTSTLSFGKVYNMYTYSQVVKAREEHKEAQKRREERLIEISRAGDDALRGEDLS